MSVSICVWNLSIYGWSWQAYVLNRICPNTTWSKSTRLVLPFPSTRELSKVTGYSARFLHFAYSQHQLYLLVTSIALILSSLPSDFYFKTTGLLCLYFSVSMCQVFISEQWWKEKHILSTFSLARMFFKIFCLDNYYWKALLCPCFS